MELTADQRPPELVEPVHQNRRRFLAVGVIFAVLISLLISIFTQPFLSTANAQQVVPQTQEGAAQDVPNDTQRNENIANGLAWVAQIVVSFIALLSSIAELTGVSIRALFGSRAAKTSVEQFPFYAFQDYDKLLDYLFPDPKTPLLPDRSVKYLPQISTQGDEAFQRKGMVLISGKSKTGKTREACEMLRRWWYSSPTVLVVRSHVGLYPPFKIPENLPVRNLILFFDDIDRYLGDSQSLKRLDDTLQFFQEICHNRGEVRVIATARQEHEFWEKLRYDPLQRPWTRFERIQLEPLSSEKAGEVIAELSQSSGISVEPELQKALAEKNNGTFLNLVLAFRSWSNQSIRTITPAEVKSFEGSLLHTWQRRYEDLANLHSGIKPVYAAINFLQSRNITLYPDLIHEVATEMGIKKWNLSAIGMIDRLQNWLVMSQSFNWYRDPKRRRAGWIALFVAGIIFLYLFIYAFLILVPVGTLLRWFDELSTSLRIQLICLSPLWFFMILLGVYLLLPASRSFILRRTKKQLDFLLETEIPLRGNELRPYENQVEGNGSTANWPIPYYAADQPEGHLPPNVSHRMTNIYLMLAEGLRLNGEVSPARKFASLAQALSPLDPAPPFMLGKIELDDGNLPAALQQLNASETLYGNSSNRAHARERRALCYVFLGEYENAETLANDALKEIGDLLSARWIIAIAQLKQDKTDVGKENYLKALNNPIPAEIQKVLVQTGLHGATWLTGVNSAVLGRKKLHSSRWRVVRNILTPLLFAALVGGLFFSLTNYVKLGFHQENSESRLRFSNFLLKIFPRSPIMYVNRGADYVGLGDYENAIADYSESLRRSPDALVYFYRGNLFYRQNESERAIADYGEAARLDPKIVDSCYTDLCYSAVINLTPKPSSVQDYVTRAAAYLGLVDYEKALTDLSQAIRINPQYPQAYYTRGLVFTHLGEYEKAIQDFTEASRLNPKHDGVYFQRGLAYQRLGKYEKALDDLNQAIRLDPSAYFYAVRGIAYYRDLGEYEKAIADFTQAIHLSADYAYSYYYRGHAHEKLGEAERAAADYLQAIRIDASFAQQCDTILCFNAAIRVQPADAQIHRRRAEFYQRAGRAEEAIADYMEALRLAPQFAASCTEILCFTAVINLNPQNAQAYRNRGFAFSSLGDSAKAIEDYLKALQLDPKLGIQCFNVPCYTAITKYYSKPGNASDYVTRGFAYHQIADYAKAIADYAEAIRRDPELINYCSNLSYCAAIINYYSDPGDAQSYTKRGYAYYLSREYEKAITDFTEAIRLDAAFARAHYLRGNSYAALNQNESAIADYTGALRLDSELSKQCMHVLCYTVAIQLDPSNAWALLRRGNAHYYSYEYEEAMKDWSDAVHVARKESDAQMLSDLMTSMQTWISEEARAGHIEQALEWLSRTDQLQMAVDANTLNSVCWFGSLWGHAGWVIDECEQAVLLAPDNANIRDSRGLARALTGDPAGAISDFQYLVTNSVDVNAVAQRKVWIPELQKGNNPFTAEVLESLK